MRWIVMGFEGTGKQWWLTQDREDLRYADKHKVQGKPERNKKTDKTTKQVTGSFVADFVRKTATSQSMKKYFPGPNIQGSNCDDIFRDAQAWYEGRRQLANVKLCLVGYSRGGYIAMCFAKYLASIDVKVDFMGLFDPVRMDLSMQRWRTGRIADTVKEVRIAYRSGRIGSRRNSMDKMGKKYACGVSTLRLECPGSHGALGGFPNGAGIFDEPLLGQGHPDDPKKFHPEKEWTAWWHSGNFISKGAKNSGVPVKALVPANGARFCLPKSEWYKKVSYGSKKNRHHHSDVRRPLY